MDEEAHPTQLHCTFWLWDTVRTLSRLHPTQEEGGLGTPHPFRHLVSTSPSLLLLQISCSASLITSECQNK